MTALHVAFVMFPLILPVWEGTPFTSENTKLPDQELHVSDAKLDIYYGYLNEFKDPSVRLGITAVFADASNRTAVKMLEARLGAEKDENVVSETLVSLYKLKRFGRPEKISLFRDLMKSPNPHVRAYSGALYALSGGSHDEILKLLEEEKSEFVSNFLWQFYSENARGPDAQKLISFLSGSNIRNSRRGAARMLASISKSGADAAELEKYCADNDISVRAAIAQGLAESESPAPSLIRLLSKDSSPSVRALAASAFSRSDEARKAIIELSADKDFDVRRLACSTLGKYADDDAVEALIKRLTDECVYVRDAAEDSIVAINPADKFITQIETACLDDGVGRDSAVRIFGLLGKKQFSGKITAILSSSGSEETKVRACNALSLLLHKEAWQAVSARSKDDSPRVRQAAAAALGKFNVQESYPAIAELINDKVLAVKCEALKSAGLSGSDFFKAALVKDAFDFRGAVSADIRAAACWSLARIKASEPAVISQMERLATQKVIIIPMAPEPAYDAMHSRASAFWAIAEFGRTSAEARKCAERIYAAYSTPADSKNFDPGHPGLHLNYFKQAVDYMNGKKSEKEEMPLVEPEFQVNPYKK